MEKFNFIRTTDSNTKSLLLSQGFKIVSDNKDCYVFINETNKLNFDSIDKTKIQYTNMLYI